MAHIFFIMEYHNQNNTVIPRLSLVGAGPGDPELISVKGARTLADADVVLYDALVDPRMLNYARPSALRIFTGERAGGHPYTQDELNVLIVRHALQPAHVVRLHGGDPLVFGSGYEELAFARKYGIELNIVPGISSVASVPGFQGLPLTARGIHDSFWVVTGTTSTGGLSEDLTVAAGTDATVVILMGMRKLVEISDLFRSLGKADLPAAIIQRGPLEDEAYALGTAGTLPEMAEAWQLGSPGLIVTGPVVRLHPEWGRGKFAYLARERGHRGVA